MIQNIYKRCLEEVDGTMRTKNFTGKVALVTGGSKGIGAGIVFRLAADDASVAFTYSSSEEKALQLVREIESAGGKALSLKADSASAKELRAAVARTTEAFGTLDIFVSNAGIFTRGTSTPTVSKTSTAWWPSMSVPPSSVFRRPPKK
jgi:NAD(P)-dependent dehydrogenase (short-subunit alcohol dehydrogenase family)